MVSCINCKRKEAPGVPTMSHCTGCFQYFYCDATCQAADRANHRDVCETYKRAHTPGPAPIQEAEGWDAAALAVAAKRGCAFSQGCLALCYANGLGGVALDHTASLRWYSLAVSSHPPPPAPPPPDWILHNYACCFYWGRGTPVDHATAVRLLRPLAERGDPSSQHILGDCFQHGEGVPCDPVEGFSWIQRAADAGHPPALNSLGLAVYRGQGVPPSKARAVTYFQLAAEAGDTEAMCNLARCLWLGVGAPRDAAAALEWLERARAAGDANAAGVLAGIAAGAPTPPLSDGEESERVRDG